MTTSDIVALTGDLLAGPFRPAPAVRLADDIDIPMYRIDGMTARDVEFTMDEVMYRELTYDGLRAAEAKGNKGGRRPAIATTTSAAALSAPPSPTSCPEYTAADPGTPVPELRPSRASHVLSGDGCSARWFGGRWR